MALTREKLRQLIRYDAETGQFFRRLKPSRRHPTEREVPCGRIDDKGYVIIFVDGRHHKAHRLAWLLVTGSFPDEQIDHIDRCRANNRWANLREASNSENQANIGARKTNRVGLKGAHFYSAGSCWSSRICVRGERRFLGYFKQPEDAHAAYMKAAATLNPEFGRA